MLDSARALAARVDAANPSAALGTCRAATDAAETMVGAWIALDWDAAARQLENLQTTPGWTDLPLAGLPVGIKDVFDTVDFPTGYGSKIYSGHRPLADAVAVTLLRKAGAIVPGKTVSTEFAYWRPGKTRNPLDPSRSPGGSSSGSVAAVASGMVPFAIGTQTAASTIRPASYCGIVGFKPTLGLVSLVGVKALAGSMDTIGLFARSVDDMQMLADVVLPGARDEAATESGGAMKFRMAVAEEWSVCAPHARANLMAAADAIRSAGAPVDETSPPAPFDALCEEQKIVMAVEAARDLANERLYHWDALSEPLRALMQTGLATPATAYLDALRARDVCLADLDALFGDADFLIAPSTADEAPLFDDGTGTPDLSRAWTLLGLPSITVPSGTGPNGLPLGLQISARPYEDARLLNAAAWVETLGIGGAHD